MDCKEKGMGIEVICIDEVEAEHNWQGDGQGNGTDNILDDERIKQLQFISWEDAESFYTSYSLKRGFTIGKRDSCRSQECGGFLMQHWVCQKEGHRDKKWLHLTNRKRKAKPNIREDCHAHLLVKLDHNINKRSATSAKTMQKAGVKTKHISKVILGQCRGFENTGSMTKDIHKVADADRSSETETSDPASDNNRRPFNYFLGNSSSKALLSDDQAAVGIKQESIDAKKDLKVTQSNLDSGEGLENSKIIVRKRKFQCTSRMSATSLAMWPSKNMTSECCNSNNLILPEEIQPIVRVDPLLDLDLDLIIPGVDTPSHIEISSALSLVREVLSKGLSEITPEIREAMRSSIHVLLQRPNLPAVLVSNLQQICDGVSQLPGKFASNSSEKKEFSTKLSLFETTITLASAERRIFAKMSQEEKAKYEEYKQNREAIQNLHEQLKQLMEKSVMLKKQYSDLSHKVSAKEAELQRLGQSLCQQRNDLPSWQLGLARADDELASVEMEWADLQSLPFA